MQGHATNVTRIDGDRDGNIHLAGSEVDPDFNRGLGQRLQSDSITPLPKAGFQMRDVLLKCCRNEIVII